MHAKRVSVAQRDEIRRAEWDGEKLRGTLCGLFGRASISAALGGEMICEDPWAVGRRGTQP